MRLKPIFQMRAGTTKASPHHSRRGVAPNGTRTLTSRSEERERRGTSTVSMATSDWRTSRRSRFLAALGMTWLRLPVGDDVVDLLLGLIEARLHVGLLLGDALHAADGGVGHLDRVQV